MASGGMRPGAPQNNPANVSGTGGAGQSGNYTGFAYGQNQTVNNQRIEGNQAMASAQAATPSAPASTNIRAAAAVAIFPTTTCKSGKTKNRR